MYTENKSEPILEAYDPFVLPVQFMGFASYQGASVEFLFNCTSDKTTVDTSSNDIQKQPVETPINDLSRVPLDGMNSNSPFQHLRMRSIYFQTKFHFLALVKKCETEETWELDYNKFHELATFKNSQADGYAFKLNFFVHGQKEVHILLSSTEKPNIEKDSAYEIGKCVQSLIT